MTLLSQYCWCDPSNRSCSQFGVWSEDQNKQYNLKNDEYYQATLSSTNCETFNYGVQYPGVPHQTPFKTQKKRGSMLEGYKFIKEVRKDSDGTPNIGMRL